MVKITTESIKGWLAQDVTMEFFDRVKVILADADMMVHRALKEYQLNEAALFNAGKAQIEDVLDIPERMVEDAKEER